VDSNIINLEPGRPAKVDLERRKLMVTAGRLSLGQVKRLNEIASLMCDELDRKDPENS
jgi:hypothetical protein